MKKLLLIFALCMTRLLFSMQEQPELQKVTDPEVTLRANLEKFKKKSQKLKHDMNERNRKLRCMICSIICCYPCVLCAKCCCCCDGE